MTYPATVLADTPIRYYELNELSGTTATDSGSQAHNGTYEGSYTLAQSSLLSADTGDTSVLFNSSPSLSDIFMTASGLPSGASAWSQEAWIQTATLPGNGVAYAICGWGTDNAGQRAYLLLQGTADAAHAEIVLTTLDAGTAITSSAQIAANASYHLVATYDGATTTLYINAVSAGTGSGTLNLVATFAGIARLTTDNLHANHLLIQHVAFYSTALSGAKVTTHYNAGVSSGPTINIMAATDTVPGFDSVQIVQNAATTDTVPGFDSVTVLLLGVMSAIDTLAAASSVQVVQLAQFMESIPALSLLLMLAQVRTSDTTPATSSLLWSQVTPTALVVPSNMVCYVRSGVMVCYVRGE
jgi:hypothetical protein